MQLVIHNITLFGVLVNCEMSRKFQLELDISLTASIHVSLVAMKMHRIHCVVQSYFSAT